MISNRGQMEEIMQDLKSYTLAEIAEKYDVSSKTMRIWIRPIRKELLAMYPHRQRRLRILLPRQVKRIIEFLG